MKSRDMLYSMLKEPLIDEQVQYLAQKTKKSPRNKVVAILGEPIYPES